MNTLQTPHPAHVYAEGIRARLPLKLEQARKAANMSRYRLEKTSGITLQTIGEIERGETNPSMCVIAQICHGMGLTASVSSTQIPQFREHFAVTSPIAVEIKVSPGFNNLRISP